LSGSECGDLDLETLWVKQLEEHTGKEEEKERICLADYFFAEDNAS